MPIKTYVLLDSMDSHAPIYQTTADGKRMQIKKIPYWRPYLRVTFQTEDGKSKTIRYKSSATDAEGNSVLDQREQIDKLKIDANEPFTKTERRDLEFRNGILVTNKLISQDYLGIYPGIEGFAGFCDDVSQPVYKLLDDVLDAKIKNTDMRKRITAANKVIHMGLEEAQAMLIRLNGSFFETPKNVDDCQNILMEFIDDAEDAGLNAVLQKDSEINIDDKTTILIGKLLNQGTLSFDAIEGKISKKDKDDKWVTIRDMSAEYSVEERKRLFSDFLNSPAGKLLKDDLEKDLGGDEAVEEGIEEKKRMGRPPKIS